MTLRLVIRSRGQTLRTRDPPRAHLNRVQIRVINFQFIFLSVPGSPAHCPIMFKGILPSKRIVSSDFTMVTNFGDPGANGKENQPGTLPPPGALKGTKPALSMSKGFAQSYEKKRTETQDKDRPTEVLGMNQAFDKLLVCLPTLFAIRYIHFISWSHPSG